MDARQELGITGEDAAARFLELKGYSILDRRWRCSHGEIDIVAANAHSTVIVEVKTRRSLRFGSPFEAIVPSKLRRLRELAVLWSRAHQSRGPLRIDIIGIVDGEEGFHIEHREAVA
ncbi:YraN family protein [Humidisolicoccus flavus]|uniref:YraN family protein n=1 Tax=Humidisolicoccus flavus TaxID=3111414 RepID=UPI003248B3D6